MNKILFIVFSVCIMAKSVIAQKEIRINYFKPYQYHEFAGQLVAKAWLSADEMKVGCSIFLDGKEIRITKVDSGKVVLFLPMVGKAGELIFYSEAKSNKKVISKQVFTPLISSDWGYFGKGKIHLICSSHQDIAWMNTPDSCRHERIHDIIIPALDIMDKDPKFKFEMEQTLNLIEVLEEVPSEKQRIIEAFKRGQFTWGATYIQPYEGLESGEQLVRQSYFGRKWILDNMPGMDALAAYNVDVPGRTLQFPQILEKSGIKYLFVSRFQEGFYNWYSPNGSKVLTYSPGNYGWSLLVYKYFEDDAITALQKLNDVIKNWEAYYASHNLPAHYAIVISTDAAGPKNYSPLIDEWNEIAKESGFEIPELQHSTAEEFLADIDVPGAKFDSIYGERPNLWLYIHGPAHYEAIKAKKAAAVSLTSSEIFSSIACMLEENNSTYPSSDLNKAWSKAIYPDHGWGGKHGEITDSIFKDCFEQANSIGLKLTEKALLSLVARISLKKSDNIVVFNNLSWARDGMVTVDISDHTGTDWSVIDTSGNIVPSNVTESGKFRNLSFIATKVPSIGYKTYILKKAKTNLIEQVKVGSNYCENKFYRLELNNGGVKKLLDKELNRYVFNTTKYQGGDVINLGYKGNGAGEFVQVHPTDNDGYESLGTKVTDWLLIENSPLCAKYEAKYQMNGFTIKQIIVVYHQIKRIDFEYDIPNWAGEHNRQLRATFPLLMKDAHITYDVPMGIVNIGEDELTRSPGGWAWGGYYRQMPKEINPREIENFITASDNELGVTLSTNISVADWIDPTRESVDYTVLQSILLSSHKSCHSEGNWYHQTGSHKFRISLTSHQPGWKNGYNFGVEGNNPLLPVKVQKQQDGSLPAEMSFLTVSSPFVRVTTLKKAENDDNFILRCVEMEGKQKNIEIDLFSPVKNVVKTNLIEIGEEATGQNGKKIKVHIGKNAIETFRLIP